MIPNINGKEKISKMEQKLGDREKSIEKNPMKPKLPACKAYQN